MYEDLVKRLWEYAKEHCPLDRGSGICGCIDARETADAIEELRADNDALNGTITNLLEQIKDLGKSRWIPVTERLPEKRKWVLCRCEANIIEVLRWENDEWYYDPMHVYYPSFVTHWMLLPELPKEET